MRRLGELRHRKQALKTIKELDAFPKVPDNYQEKSASGGSVSLVSFMFIAILVMSEFWYYRAIETKYNYEVDTDVNSKLRINVDLTVAMKCGDIGADVLDLAGGTIDIGDNLKLEPTYFEITYEQDMWLRMMLNFRGVTDGIRALKLMREFKSDMPTYMPSRKDSEEKDGKPHDACRVYGSFEVNKVAGNFHITAGKSVYHPRGHAHLSALVGMEAMNYSHRIDLLSFGPAIPGYINSLDGDTVIAEKNLQMYQYYIKVVPTAINLLNRKEMKSNQYSVTQRIREINHNSGSHGVAGIFFKYDMSSIMVKVEEKRRSFWGFLVRLCGIVGGIFSTSGMLHSLVGFLFDLVMCQYWPRKKETSQVVVPPSPSTLQTNGNQQSVVPRPPDDTQPVIGYVQPAANILPATDALGQTPNQVLS